MEPRLKKHANDCNGEILFGEELCSAIHALEEKCRFTVVLCDSGDACANVLRFYPIDKSQIPLC